MSRPAAQGCEAAGMRRRVAAMGLAAIAVAACAPAARRQAEGAPATAAATATDDRSLPGPFAVQVQEFASLVDPIRPPRRVPLKLHRPVGAGTAELRPWIVVSHGAGGSWDGHHAQAQHLASHGYGVVCIEHVGSNTARLMAGGEVARNLRAMVVDREEMLGRPLDVRFAIDQVLRWQRDTSAPRGSIGNGGAGTANPPRLDWDPARVGLLGHSYGAYTALVAAGARPALDWLQPADGRTGLGPDLRDPRLRAAVALSPQGPGEPFFLSDSFASISIPVLGLSGTRDQLLGGMPAETRRASFDRWPANGRHRFVWLAEANHFDFGDSSGSAVRGIPSRTRADVQPVVRAATLAFLDLHLRGDATAADRLTEAALRPYLRGAVDAVEVRSR
jgi:predicted dienelactone hydrolase